MKKNNKTFYNANDAAKYMGISRQRFYVVKQKYQIPIAYEQYNMKFYAALELDKVRRLLDKWAGNNGK